MSDILKENLSTLANATELGAAIIEKVAGEDISTRVNGQRFSPNDLRAAVAAKIQSGLISEGNN